VQELHVSVWLGSHAAGQPTGKHYTSFEMKISQWSAWLKGFLKCTLECILIVGLRAIEHLVGNIAGEELCNDCIAASSVAYKLGISVLHCNVVRNKGRRYTKKGNGHNDGVHKRRVRVVFVFKLCGGVNSLKCRVSVCGDFRILSYERTILYWQCPGVAA
jgi:hypothetical protein